MSPSQWPAPMPGGHPGVIFDHVPPNIPAFFSTHFGSRPVRPKPAADVKTFTRPADEETVLAKTMELHVAFPEFTSSISSPPTSWFDLFQYFDPYEIWVEGAAFLFYVIQQIAMQNRAKEYEMSSAAEEWIGQNLHLLAYKLETGVDVIGPLNVCFDLTDVRPYEIKQLQGIFTQKLQVAEERMAKATGIDIPGHHSSHFPRRFTPTVATQPRPQDQLFFRASLPPHFGAVSPQSHGLSFPRSRRTSIQSSMYKNQNVGAPQSRIHSASERVTPQQVRNRQNSHAQSTVRQKQYSDDARVTQYDRWRTSSSSATSCGSQSDPHSFKHFDVENSVYVAWPKELHDITDRIQMLLSQCGRIVKWDGRIGFGFAQFDNPEPVHEAIRRFHEYSLPNGKMLTIARRKIPNHATRQNLRHNTLTDESRDPSHKSSETSPHTEFEILSSRVQPPSFEQHRAVEGDSVKKQLSGISMLEEDEENCHTPMAKLSSGKKGGLRTPKRETGSSMTIPSSTKASQSDKRQTPKSHKSHTTNSSKHKRKKPSSRGSNEQSTPTPTPKHTLETNKNLLGHYDPSRQDMMPLSLKFEEPSTNNPHDVAADINKAPKPKKKPAKKTDAAVSITDDPVDTTTANSTKLCEDRKPIPVTIEGPCRKASTRSHKSSPKAASNSKFEPIGKENQPYERTAVYLDLKDPNDFPPLGESRRTPNASSWGKKPFADVIKPPSRNALQPDLTYSEYSLCTSPLVLGDRMMMINETPKTNNPTHSPTSSSYTDSCKYWPTVRNWI